MKRKVTALLAFTLAGSFAHAAGVTKALKATVDETLLQGYTATPPVGWTQYIQYAVATSVGDSPQTAAALVAETASTFGGGYPTTLPRAAGISRISLSTGAILSKENLPTAAQVARGECTFPSGGGAFLGCAPATISVSVDKALPGRLVVTVLKSLFSSSTATSSFRSLTYIFDPAAAVGTADRWTKVQDISAAATSFALLLPAISGGRTSPDQNFYLFSRSAPTTTQIFQLTPK